MASDLRFLYLSFIYVFMSMKTYYHVGKIKFKSDALPAELRPRGLLVLLGLLFEMSVDFTDTFTSGLTFFS